MKRILISALLILPFLTFNSCVINDENTVIVQPTRTYQLGAPNGNSVGTARISKNDDNSITIDIQLSNTSAGVMHPAHIHMNTVAEGGAIAITLNDVNGSTGLSSTTFSTLDSGSSINYTQLTGYDGHINVHASASDLGTLIAQGDIGQNELTGVSKSYTLDEADVMGIQGSATFYERFNGKTVAVLQLFNTLPGESHPAHIHMNDVNTGGSILFTFNPVNGNNGISVTEVSSYTYQEILTLNAHINVHLSAADLATYIAQGNIGSNALQ